MPTLSDSDLCYLTAGNALKLFAAGVLSPLALMEAISRRIAAVSPAINAFGDLYLNEAFARAREAERRWRNGTARALEGIPVAVKDAQRVAGWRGQVNAA